MKRKDFLKVAGVTVAGVMVGGKIYEQKTEKMFVLNIYNRFGFVVGEKIECCYNKDGKEELQKYVVIEVNDNSLMVEPIT